MRIIEYLSRAPVPVNRCRIAREMKMGVVYEQVIHSSPSDLVADKILTLTRVGGFGRERFKDVYDLAMLLDKVDIDFGIVKKKLAISERSSVKSGDIVMGALDTLTNMADHYAEAAGFVAMVARHGKAVVDDWEALCLRTGENLRESIL